MKTPFLIIGYERSGTTLVRRTMSMHPGLGHDIIHENLKTLLKCKNRKQAVQKLTYPAKQHGMITGMASILSGQKIPYTKFATAKKAVEHFVRLFADTSIIHVVREPVGVINSQVKTFKHDEMQCVRRYFGSVSKVTDYLKNSKFARVITVGYGDIISSPQKALASLYAWMGQKVDDEHIAKVVSTREPWQHDGRAMCGLRYFDAISDTKSKIILSTKCLCEIRARI